MDKLKEELLDLVKRTCDVLANQTIPTRVWTRIKDDKGLTTPDSAEHRTNWTPFAYLLIRPLSLSPVLKKLIRALQNVPEIARKIVIQVDNDDDFVLYSGHMAEWLWSSVIVPYLDESFHQFQRITFDERLFEKVFDRFIEHVDQIEPHLVRYITGLVNVKVLSEIDLGGGVTVRPLSLDEIETWLNDSQTNLMQTGSLLSVQCAIEYIHHHSVNKPDVEKHLDAVMANENIKVQLVDSLRLVTNAPVTGVFTEQHTESVLLRSNIITTSPNPQIFPGLLRFLTAFEQEQKGLLIELWKNIHSRQNPTFPSLAFSRWAGAFDRSRDEDRLIDCWVGLESLFAPDSSQEVKFRSSLRLAAWLGRTPQQRKEIYDDARLSYDWRSAVVHGNEDQLRKLKKKSALSEISAKTRKYLREAILKVAESESFDPKAIETALLLASAKGAEEK